MFDRKEYMNKWRIENKEKIKEYMKQYIEKNKERLKKYRSKRIKENREYQIIYRSKNDKKVKNNRNRYEKKRKEIDLKYNLNDKMRSSIRLSLKGNKNGRHWETLVGYTLDDLVKRLKKTMPEGYCWEDYINGRLHLDHKIPISVFNFEKPEHINFKRCWALKNLQLLPARENLIKSNKIKKPFQLSLQV